MIALFLTYTPYYMGNDDAPLLMGFLGATLRYALEAALPAGSGFPVATLSVNIFGCFTLEIINQYVARRTKLPAPLVWRCMCTGISAMAA